MPLHAQIRDEVRLYVEGIISLEEFRDWFVPRSWDVEESRDFAAIALAHRIDGILGESSSVNWTEEDIREAVLGTLNECVEREDFLRHLD